MNDSQILEKLWTYTMPEPNTGCWIWFGASTPLGYGKVRYKGGVRIAHRVSYMVYRGDFDPKLCVCHKCDNPFCINPDHLFLGTMKDNTQDMIRKGRKNPCLGSNHKTSKLSVEQVLEIKKLIQDRPISLNKIAKLFGVTHSTITAIRDNKIWKWAKLDVKQLVNSN